MKWETYKKQFTKEAKKNGKNAEYIKAKLLYAKKLFDQDLPVIYNQEHFSLLVKYDSEYVHRMSNAPHRFYRSFTIGKKNGGKRTIDEPLPDLKSIQKWVLKEILYSIDISAYAKAYVPNRSIRDNARFHRGQNFILTTDIKDFFPSISLYKVISVFLDLGYSNEVATFIGNLCCLNECLPQGAPTSPALSNIIFKSLDVKISELSQKHKLRFTRYADDMTFSGEKYPDSLLRNISRILFEDGFTLNKSKTRILYQNRRQIVTGVVVNEKMQVSREKRDKIRQEVYYIKKYGLESHLDMIKEQRSNYLQHIIGVAEYMLFINPKDKKIIEIRDYLRTLYLD